MMKTKEDEKNCVFAVFFILLLFSLRFLGFLFHHEIRQENAAAFHLLGMDDAIAPFFKERSGRNGRVNGK